jgi:hypothetical protein
MERLGFEELVVRDSMCCGDPVEMHIIRQLKRLINANKRLKAHIEKTGAWAQLKSVDTWKPFDFYNYFCTKYQERYGTTCRSTGNVVVLYQMIEEFQIKNNISKSAYKDFIDKAFKEYFNNINLPNVANICSITLYRHLMGANEINSASQFKDFDRAMICEAEAFEEHVQRFNSDLC